MIYVVLGMHKSGTTLISRALHESGIVMGQEFPAGMDYANAKYEARWAQKINDEILGVDRRTLSLLVTSKLLPGGEISDGIKDRMKHVIAENQSRYSDWGFKDPKTVLTYHYWKEILPDHRLVIIYRNPVEVWKRYSAFKQKTQFRLPYKVWCDFNQLILHHANKAEEGQAILLNFDCLLSEAREWDRFCDFVGIKLKDIRDTKQSVNRLAVRDREKHVYKLLMFLAGEKAKKTYQELNKLHALWSS